MPLLLTGLITLVVSFILTARAEGFPPAFFATWVGGWLFAWAIAFPVALLTLPFVRRLVAMLVEP